MRLAVKSTLTQAQSYSPRISRQYSIPSLCSSPGSPESGAASVQSPHRLLLCVAMHRCCPLSGFPIGPSTLIRRLTRPMLLQYLLCICVAISTGRSATEPVRGRHRVTQHEAVVGLARTQPASRGHHHVRDHVPQETGPD